MLSTASWATIFSAFWIFVPPALFIAADREKSVAKSTRSLERLLRNDPSFAQKMEELNVEGQRRDWVSASDMMGIAPSYFFHLIAWWCTGGIVGEGLLSILFRGVPKIFHHWIG